MAKFNVITWVYHNQSSALTYEHNVEAEQMVVENGAIAFYNNVGNIMGKTCVASFPVNCSFAMELKK